jgi:hypothetical protein
MTNPSTHKSVRGARKEGTQKNRIGGRSKREQISFVCFRQKGGGVSIMPLVQVMVVLIVVGVLLWLVNRFIPMAGSIKSILNAVVVIVVVLWLLSVFGILGSLSGIRVGK